MQKINIDSRIKDKFCMPVEENIFIAKRLLVDSIYQQANLEGIAATYAQTIDILNNVNVASLAPNEINKICYLRDGWHYVLDNLDAPLVINKILIHHGRGLFNVPVNLDGEFKQRLVTFYESNDCQDFVKWIADNCIIGL